MPWISDPGTLSVRFRSGTPLISPSNFPVPVKCSHCQSLTSFVTKPTMHLIACLLWVEYITDLMQDDDSLVFFIDQIQQFLFLLSLLQHIICLRVGQILQTGLFLIYLIITPILRAPRIIFLPNYESKYSYIKNSYCYNSKSPASICI
jgi:hypothetical protein